MVRLTSDCRGNPVYVLSRRFRGDVQVNGDMNAYLYTSSRAMHSEILNLLMPQVRFPACFLNSLVSMWQTCREQPQCLQHQIKFQVQQQMLLSNQMMGLAIAASPW